jgi:hypothetical protein
VGPAWQREKGEERALGLRRGKWAGVESSGVGREKPEEKREGEGSWAAGREPAQEGWAAFLSSSFSFLFPLLNYSSNLFEFK